MRKGHIILVPFPFTDLSGQKVRPALVLHAGRGEDCIVAFVSSLKAKRTRFNIPIRATRENGLKADSNIRVDKIATLERKIVLGELGAASKEIMSLVDAMLRKVFLL